MHVSYISLAFFAVGAIAAPAAPKPSNDFGDIASGFPFNPTGSSTIEDGDEGFGNSFPSALDAMHQALIEKQQSAEAAQHASGTHTGAPKPTHAVANFPAPVVSQASSLSQANPVASEATVVSKAALTTAIPTPSHSIIPTPKGTASPSSSATPSPSATPPAGPLSGLVNGIPLVGGIVHGPLAGLGLHR